MVKTTRHMEQWWLVPSSQQCPCPHGLECAAVFGKIQHDGYPSSSLFTRPCAMRCFPVPSYEMPDERETFWWCQRSEKENSGGLEQHQHWRVPEMFSAVGKSWYKRVESKGEYFEGDWSCNSIKPNRPLKKINPAIFGSSHVYIEDSTEASASKHRLCNQINLQVL